MFKELTQAGTSILGTAQAAIYSTDDYLIGHQMQSSIRQAEKDLNTVFMRYALSREAYFRTEKVSASGDVDDSRILWDIGCRHDSAASWNPCGPYRAPPIKLWWSKSLPSAESEE